MSPCDDCLRRSWLLARLAGHLERARERGRRLPLVLALEDSELLDALAGADRASIAAERAAFAPEHTREALRSAHLEAVCQHEATYPLTLRDAPDAPAVLHVAGGLDRLPDLASGPTVAIVGTRRASPYGLEVAGGLARGLAAAGVTVVSGLALGIDSAAHEGALSSGGATIAVLAGGADRPYPASKRGLYRRIVERSVVLSEMPPGTRPWRWMFPARNRLIAGLAPLTVVVEGMENSGSLITAGLAEDLGREVAAVPGRVTSPLAAGPHSLLAAGAHLVRGASDVLELLFGAGHVPAPPAPPPALAPRLAEVLGAVSAGAETAGDLLATGVALPDALAALGELELLGRVRRGPGGRYVPSSPSC